MSIRVHQPKISIYCMWSPGSWNTFFLFFYLFLIEFFLRFFILFWCFQIIVVNVLYWAILYVWYLAPFLKSNSFLSFLLFFSLFYFFCLLFLLWLRRFQQKDKFSCKCCLAGIELKLVHTQRLQEMQGLFWDGIKV